MTSQIMKKIAFALWIVSTGSIHSTCKPRIYDSGLTQDSSRQDFPDSSIANYEFVDSLGVPFIDTVLGERQQSWNTGAQNLFLQGELLKRLYHLSWGFSPGLKAMGFDPCFHLDGIVSDYKKSYDASAWTVVGAAPRLLTCVLMRVRMPDDSWLKPGKRSFKPPIVAQLFWPNTLTVDLDTTGEWPFGRRVEDQVASRFLSLFLDMHKGRCGGPLCNVDSLQRPELGGKISSYSGKSPGLPINPLQNDKPFLKTFPYLAEPWEAQDYP